MNEILNRFKEISADPYGAVKGWKEKTGKKVIGVVPMHIPEEIIHAAGMLPVVLWESDEPITIANSYSAPTICGFPRSIFDDAMKGKLKFIDGIVYCDCCLAERQFTFLMQNNAKPSYNYLIYLPQRLDDSHSRDNLVKQLKRFSNSLEEFGGQSITDDELQQSIKLYNKNRSLLRNLYDFRRNNPGVLKARDMVAVVQSGMLMPKEKHNRMLEDLLGKLEKQAGQPSAKGKVRIVVSGSMCEACRPDILDTVEKAGGMIVDDDLYVGGRYSITDAAEGTDPFDALADRFLKMNIRCPSKSQDSTNWADQIIAIAEKSQARGVISLAVRFCEPHYFFFNDIRHNLDRAGLRVLMLEMEHEATPSNSAQIETRIGAFIETCKEGN